MRPRDASSGMDFSHSKVAARSPANRPLHVGQMRQHHADGPTVWAGLPVQIAGGCVGDQGAQQDLRLSQDIQGRRRIVTRVNVTHARKTFWFG